MTLNKRQEFKGVSYQMKNFDFLFGSMLGEMVLRHTDNLSRTLQDKMCSAAEGQQIAGMVIRTLQSLRNDESFDLFWSRVTNTADPLDIEPKLPRKHKVPRRFESWLSEGHFHDDVKDLYRQLYFEAFDLSVNCIQDRFQQPGYIPLTKIWSNLS